jgi:hypothetical protein
MMIRPDSMETDVRIAVRTIVTVHELETLKPALRREFGPWQWSRMLPMASKVAGQKVTITTILGEWDAVIRSEGEYYDSMKPPMSDQTHGFEVTQARLLCFFDDVELATRACREYEVARATLVGGVGAVAVPPSFVDQH